LRLFPGFFVAGMACKTLRLRPGREGERLLIAFLLGCALLVGATLALPGGVEAWGAFAERIRQHMATDAFNTIGLGAALTAILRALGRPEWATSAHVGQLVVALLVVLFMWRRALRDSDVLLTVMAIPLLFACLDLAAYYYVFLVVFVLVRRDDPAKLALLFAAEAAVYVLRLFETRDAVLYAYRNVIVAGVILGMYREELRTELAAGFQQRFRRNTVSR
jgi:hypothetical protein